MSSRFSSNVISAKVLAMYGKRIKSIDYDNLTSCKSVSEVACYLKNETTYSRELKNIDEINIRRHELEFLVRNKLLNDLAVIGKYEFTTREIFAQYIIIKSEVELMLHILMNLLSVKREYVYYDLPDFFKVHTKLNLNLLLSINDYDDFYKFLGTTPYYKLLLKLKPNLPTERINLSKVEQILYNYLYEDFFKSIDGIKNKNTKEKLKNIFSNFIDYSNFVRIIRMHRVKNYSDFALLDHGTIKIEIIEKLKKAISEEDVFDIMRELPQGKKMLKIKYNYLDQLPKKMLYHKCRQAIHSTNDAAMIFLAYMFLSQIEIENVTNIIEGIRYSIPKSQIENFLVVKQIN